MHIFLLRSSSCCIIRIYHMTNRLGRVCVTSYWRGPRLGEWELIGVFVQLSFLFLLRYGSVRCGQFYSCGARESKSQFYLNSIVGLMIVVRTVCWKSLGKNSLERQICWDTAITIRMQKVAQWRCNCRSTCSTWFSLPLKLPWPSAYLFRDFIHSLCSVIFEHSEVLRFTKI